MSSTPTHASLPAAPAKLRFPLDHPLLWLIGLALAHVVLRMLLSPALKWDEAEQMVWSQQLALGYGTQPPLYTWLLWGMNQLLGPGLLALSVLKQALLVAAYASLWLAARELLGTRGAWWAAASMMLIPTIGWRVYTDLTHTVLVTTLTCVFWLVLLRLLRAPGRRNFMLLGTVCALGLLAKYSFALIMVATLLAMLSEPTARRTLFARGWWWALVLGAALVLPHAGWLLMHWQDATMGTLSKMEIDVTHSRIDGVINVLRDVIQNVLLFILLALAVFGRAWWHRPADPPVHTPAHVQRVLWRYLALVVLSLLGMALFGHVTEFKGRWLAPMLCVVPLAAFAAHPELQAHRHGRRYTIAIVALALVVLVAANVRPWVSGLNGNPDRLGFPLRELAAQLKQSGYDGSGMIISSDHLIAGMLRARFPGAPVRACTDIDQPGGAGCVSRAAVDAKTAGSGWLLVTCGKDAPADWWQNATRQLDSAPGPGTTVDLAYHFLRHNPPVFASCRYLWHPSDHNNL